MRQSSPPRSPSPSPGEDRERLAAQDGALFENPSRTCCRRRGSGRPASASGARARRACSRSPDAVRRWSRRPGAGPQGRERQSRLHQAHGVVTPPAGACSRGPGRRSRRCAADVASTSSWTDRSSCSVGEPGASVKNTGASGTRPRRLATMLAGPSTSASRSSMPATGTSVRCRYGLIGAVREAHELAAFGLARDRFLVGRRRRRRRERID